MLSSCCTVDTAKFARPTRRSGTVGQGLCAAACSLHAVLSNTSETKIFGAWSARIGQGYDTLVSRALKGFKGMPAKGGNPDLDDVEVARAVVHMANAAGGKFKAPDAKAPAVVQAK